MGEIKRDRGGGKRVREIKRDRGRRKTGRGRKRERREDGNQRCELLIFTRQLFLGSN